VLSVLDCAVLPDAHAFISDWKESRFYAPHSCRDIVGWSRSLITANRCVVLYTDRKPTAEIQ